MKTRLSWLAAFFLPFALLLPSCSSDKAADAEELIATVPNDASLVAVVNVGTVLEKAGCTVDGQNITAGKEASAAVAKIKDPHVRDLANAILSGKSGIDPSVIAVFRQGYYTYLTGVAADPAKFKECFAGQTGSGFKADGDVETAANVALSGNRFWVNVGQHAVDPNDIRHFKSLDKTQSFLENKQSEQLCKVDRDIKGWANITGILNSADIPFQQRATVQVALQTLFEDPSAVLFSASAEKGAFAAEASVLNSKGNTARYLLPTEKLDIKTIESIGGTTDALMAVSVPHKLIEKLTKEAESKSVSMLGIYLKMLGGIDGTAAFAYCENGDYRAVISTNGTDMSAVSDFLSQGGATVTIDGKKLRVSKGSMAGAKLPVAELAPAFKGAVAGVAVGNFGKNEGPKAGSLMLVSENGGIVFKIKAEMADKNENALLQILNL